VAAKTIDPENIVLTSGTSEGYSYIFRLLCDPGDEILVPAPSYPLFEFLADLADVRLVPYPLLYDHGWQIDSDALRAALTPRTRAVLVVHPNNPTGSFVKPREAAELAEICASRDIAIVADEVFLDYAAIKRTAGDRTSHERTGGDRAAVDRTAGAGATGDRPSGDGADGSTPRTVGESTGHERTTADRVDSGGADGAAPRTFAFGSAALTFTLSGISKICALPQMKLAWMVAGGPQHLVSAAMERLEIIADTFLSPGAPAQVALPRFLEMRGALQAQLQQRVAANLGYLDALLQSEPGPLERLAREAGWYAVLRIPSSRSDEEYAVELLERCGVLVHPGQFFNFSQEGFLVLSLIAPEDEFEEGARRLHQFFAA
jgi:aspartate/methionine/tyrosine aminotransferase